MIINTERKYSPKSIKEFVFPDSYSKEIINAYTSGVLDKPLLLYGSNGAGKSSLQRLLPDAIERRKASTYTILCSDLKTPQDVHKAYQIIEKRFNKFFRVDNQKYNYFIFDEFSIKSDKLNDALKIELDTSLGTDISIFCTNRIDEVDKGIISRCEIVEIQPCKPEMFFSHAKQIFNFEEKEIDDEFWMNCIHAVYAICPDNRKYYSAIDSIFRKLP